MNIQLGKIPANTKHYCHYWLCYKTHMQQRQESAGSEQRVHLHRHTTNKLQTKRRWRICCGPASVCCSVTTIEQTALMMMMKMMVLLKAFKWNTRETPAVPHQTGDGWPEPGKTSSRENVSSPNVKSQRLFIQHGQNFLLAHFCVTKYLFTCSLPLKRYSGFLTYSLIFDFSSPFPTRYHFQLFGAVWSLVGSCSAANANANASTSQWTQWHSLPNSD